MLDQETLRRKQWKNTLKRRKKRQAERHSKSLALQYLAHKVKSK